MKRPFRVVALPVLAVGLLAFPLAASAGHSTDPRTPNMHPLGHIEEPASLLNPAVGNPDIHTDIAFWGTLAVQGNWDGFNILEKLRENPTLRDIPVLVVSGGGLTNEQQQQLNTFGQRLITKGSLNEGQLIESIENALKRLG